MFKSLGHDDDFLPPPSKKNEGKEKKEEEETEGEDEDEMKKSKKPEGKATLKLEPEKKAPQSSLKKDTANLFLERCTPNGNCGSSCPVTLKFSLPVVPLGMIGKHQLPKVEIEPAHPCGGKWIWESCDILKYVPEGEWSRGRTYRIKICKDDLETHDGVKMKSDINFTFSITNVQPSSVYPSKWVKVENPLFLLYYYYPIDSESTFKKISVCDRRDDKSTYPVEFVTYEEAEKYFNDPKNVQYVSDLGHSGELRLERYHQNGVWFRINATLKPGSEYEVKIENRTFTFQTIGEFKLENAYPRKTNRIDKRTHQFSFNFSNPIRKDNLVVEIDPHFPEYSEWDRWRKQPRVLKRLEVQRNCIYLRGKTKGDTKYSFHFKNVEDVFGNKLADFTEEREVKPLTGRVRIGYDYYTNVVDTTPPMKKYYFSMMTLNVKSVDFRVYRLEDFVKYRSYGDPENYCGKPIHQDIVNTMAPLDAWNELNIPIKWKYLQNPKSMTGHVVVRVKPHEWMTDSQNDTSEKIFWFQFTRICLSIFQFPNKETFVCINSFDGKILQGKDVKLFTLSSPPKPIPAVREGPVFRIREDHALEGIVCRTSSDCCVNKEARHNGGLSSDWKAAYLFTDRHVYQPGETVSMKGILRKMTLPEQSKVYVVQFPEHNSEFKWYVQDVKGQKLEEGTQKFTNMNGSFHFQFILPETIPHGRCYFRMEYESQSFSTQFKVLEFRPPKFFVGIDDVTENVEKPYLLGTSVTMSVSAHYFDDQETPIENGGVKWQYRKIDNFYKSFSPTSKGYIFYEHRATKEDHYEHGGYWDDGENWSSLGTGKTGKDGTHKYTFNPGQVYPSFGGDDDWSGIKKVKRKKGEKKAIQRPNNQSKKYVINSSVSDLNQQTVSSTHTIVMYCSRKLVGVKYDTHRFKSETEYLPFQILVSDVSGNELGGEFVRVYIFDQTDSEIVLLDRLFKTDRKKSLNLGQFKLNRPLENMKEYKIYVELMSSDDEKNQKIIHWCGSNFFCDDSLFGGETGLDKIEMLQLKMIANQNIYQRGEEAKILVQCPYEVKDNLEGCSGLVISQSARVVNIQSFKIKMKEGKDDDESIVSVPLSDDCIPNIAVHCFLYGRKYSPKFGRVLTSYARGAVDVRMNVHSVRGFDVCIELDNSKKKYTPGKDAWVKVYLNKKKKKKKGDRKISLKNCLATVIIVDESILSLIQESDKSYRIQNPLEKFYRAQSLYNLTHYDLRQKIFLKKVDDDEDDDESRDKDCDDDEECEEEAEECCSRMQCQKKSFCGFSGGGGGRGGGGGAGSVTIRSNFTPLALFAPEVPVDPKKLTTEKIPFKLPDQITKFHVFAMISQEQEFGLSEDQIATDLEVSAQVGSFPYVLHLGDFIHISVLIFNKTNEKKNVIVECRVNDSILDLKTKEVKKQLKPKERVEITFGPVEAKEISDVNNVLIAVYEAKTKSYYDAIEKPLPVKFPISDETFAQYGEIKESDGPPRAIPLAVPPRKEIVPSHGGVKIELSSTILQTLQDAHEYLLFYPFACSEQVTSKVLAVINVDPISEAFNFPAQPSKGSIRRMIRSCIAKYKACQKGDGGFGYWSDSSRSYMYVSLYILQCMAYLKHYKLVQDLVNDFNVFENVFRKVVNYCMNIVRARPGIDPKKESNVLNQETSSLYSQIYLKSLAIHINVLLDRFRIHPVHYNHESLSQIILPELADLVREARRLPSSLIASSKAYVIQGYIHFSNPLKKNKEEKKKKDDIVIPEEAKEIMNQLNNSVEEISGRAVFVTSETSWDGSYVLLHSDAKMNAIVFSVILDLFEDGYITSDSPIGKLLPKLGKGVVGSRAPGMGRWRNTQENVAVLMCLRRYFDLFEKEIPDFKVDWGIGDHFKSKESIVFRGRETEVKGTEITMKSLLDYEPEESEGEEEIEKQQKVSGEVKLEKKGTGMLYYRIGLTYARNKRILDPMDRGFFIKRTYEVISGKQIPKKKKKGDDDTDHELEYTFQRGSIIRVKLEILTKLTRYHVVMTDPLPAGGDIITPQLQLSEKISTDEKMLNRGYWIVQKNYKKERMEVFSRPNMREGEYYFSYEFKAMSVGKFLTPPVKIWEMYSDEVFGRSKSNVINIV